MKPSTIICGYPGTGTIWLRWQLAAILFSDERLSFNSVFSKIPNIDSAEEKFLYNQQNEKKFALFKTSDINKIMSFPGNIIILIRPLHHVMYSLWHQEKKFYHFKGSYGVYLSERRYGEIYLEWLQFLFKNIQNFQDGNNKRCLLLRYDELQYPDTLSSISEFVGITVNKNDIKTAHGKASFENMQRIEIEEGVGIYANRSKELFVRNGLRKENKLTGLNHTAINMLEKNVHNYIQLCEGSKNLIIK